jgi:uncharacterized protein YxeA
MPRIIVFLMILMLVFSKGGVYFYRNRKTNRVHYVGKTNNFARRNKEHKRDRRYFSGAKYRMDKFYTDNRDNIEKYYINRYNPPANKIKY